MNKYELAILYHPDLEVDLDKGEQRIKKIIQDNKGKILSADNWGRKKLAYSIDKLNFAVYVFYTIELMPESIAKVESLLNITDEVMRYIIVKFDDKEQAKIESAKSDLKNKQTQVSEDLKKS